MNSSTTNINAEALDKSEIPEGAMRLSRSNVNPETSVKATNVNQHTGGTLEAVDDNAASSAQPEVTVLRGVRVRTGCNTCRKRHVKCDERKPICLNCGKGKRECVFPTVETLFRPHTQTEALFHPYTQPTSVSKKNDDVAARQSEAPNHTRGFAIEKELYRGWDAAPSLFVSRPGQVKVAHLHDESKDTAVDASLLELATVAVDHESMDQYTNPDENHGSGAPTSSKEKGKVRQQAVVSETSVSYTTQDLEQMQVESSFLPSLYPQQSISQTVSNRPPMSTPRSSADGALKQSNKLSGVYGGQRDDPASSSSQDVEPNSKKRRRLSNEMVKPHQSPMIASAKETLPLSSSEKELDEATGPLLLSHSQAYLFRNYVENLAPELDLFDLDRHFSQKIPRLARSTEALLHACLAFSGKTIYLTSTNDSGYNNSDIQLEVNQHYDIALRDVQSSLISATNNKFNTDQSMLATAVLLCAFDNLEGGSHGFVQHNEAMWTLMLRPSFSTNGGVKQAVFWSLFTQDLMTAFFAKRKTCLTKDFWQVDSLQSLRDDELACRIVYIAAQVVNFCVERPDKEEDASIIGAKSQLLEIELIKWKKALPETFEPLIELPSEAGLKELWFTLPLHGVALQIYHWAYIILIMHRPVNNIQDYITREQRYRLSSPFIIGVSLGQARKMPMWISVQCLLLAGLVVLNEVQRNAVQSLFQGCQTAKGISTKHLSEKLDKIWFNPKRWNHTYLWYDATDYK